MLQFNALGLLGLIAAIMSWSLAAVLFRVQSPGGVAHMIAILLVVEGVTLVSTGYLDLFFTEALKARPAYPSWLYAEEVIHTLGDCAMLALYPPFLAMALQTKFTQPFSRMPVRLVIAAASVVLFFAVMLSPLKVGATLLYAGLSLLFAFALISSIHAWVVSEAGAARARAGSFAFAFGFRDICWGIAYASAIWMIFTDQYAITESDVEGTTLTVLYAIYACGTLFFVPLIAYGIFRTHLFDIDLRIKWTIRQSTVASVFVAIFYLVSEGADRFLSSELGNIAGLLAAALLMFFLAPLQRFADRIASAAMPNTRNTPEYAAFRKMQVYEQAFAEAQYEGGVSAKERMLLDRLRESLGISEADAESIEGNLVGREGGLA